MSYIMKNKKIFRVGFILLLLALSFNFNRAVYADNINVECADQNFSVDKGKSKTIGYKITGTKKFSVTFSTDDKTVATVNKNGKVRGKKADSITYISITANGVTKRCPVTVNKKDTQTKEENDAEDLVNKGINKLNKSVNKTNSKDTITGEKIQLKTVKCPSKQLKVKVGKTKKIKYIVKPAGAPKDGITIVSRNKNKLQIVDNSKIKGIKKGNVKIAIKYNGKITYCKVQVLKANAKTNKKASISIDSNKNTSIKVGNSRKLSVTVKNSNNKKVIWSSSNPNVLKVNSNGKITALKKGNAKIMAKLESDKTVKSSINVTVKKNNTKTSAIVDTPTIKLNNISDKKVTMYVGSTKKINATVTPNKYKNETIKYVSSDVSIATVGSKGKITGLKPGKVKITLSIEKYPIAKTKTITVTVKKKPSYVSAKKTSIVVTNVKKTLSSNGNTTKVSKYSTSIGKGENKVLNAVVYNPPKEGQGLKWTSSNKKIVTVNSNGKIKGIKKGTAKITVSLKKDSSVKTVVNIKVVELTNGWNWNTIPPSITLVNVKNKLLTMSVGDSTKVKVKINELEKKDSKELKWVSSNKKVATVDKNGNVKALKTGSSKVTVSLKEQPKVKKEFTVKVISKKVQIVVENENANCKNVISMFSDDKKKLKTKVYANGKIFNTQIQPNFISSLPETLVVDNNGIVSSTQSIQSNASIKIGYGELTKSITVNSYPTPSYAQKNNLVLLNNNFTKVNFVETQNGNNKVKNYTLKVNGFNKKKNMQVQLTAIAYKVAAGTNETIIWSSSNKKVATVSKCGLLSIKGTGKTTVVAKLNSSPSKKLEINVTVSKNKGSNQTEGIVTTNTKIKLKNVSNNLAKVAVKNTFKAEAEVVNLAQGENGTLKWKSGNSDVAKVKSDGTITGVSTGSAKITVSLKSFPSVKKVFTVKVIENGKVIEIENENANCRDQFKIFVGDNKQIVSNMYNNGVIDTSNTYNLLPATNNANLIKLTRTNDNGKNIDTFTTTAASNDYVIQIEEGQALEVLSIYSYDKPSYVSEQPSIAFLETNGVKNKSGNSYELKTKKTDKTIKLTAVAYKLPLGTNETIVWSSSNSDIASVSKCGKLSLYKKGNVKLTAKLNSNSSIKATIDLTIVGNNTKKKTTTKKITTKKATKKKTTTIKKSSVSKNKYIFIGDSRTVGMRSAVTNNSNDTWSAKVSQGLSWMKTTGVPNVEKKINNKSNVIILMGVNDSGANGSNAGSYAKYLNKKAKEWTKKGASVYFVSVNPLSDSSKNANVKAFNSSIKKKLSKNITYIDTYNNVSFNSTDGIHYDNSTYQKIYNYIKQVVSSNNTTKTTTSKKKTKAKVNKNTNKTTNNTTTKSDNTQSEKIDINSPDWTAEDTKIVAKIEIGETVKVPWVNSNFDFNPSDYTYITTDDEIIHVNESGEIYGNAIGTTYIKVFSKKDGKQFDRILEITVVAEPTETIETDESNNENDDSFDIDLESTEITNEE